MAGSVCSRVTVGFMVSGSLAIGRIRWRVAPLLEDTKKKKKNCNNDGTKLIFYR